ncbi:MAG TPA: hypothetical protein VN276_00580, partial [Bacteroidales bacterium]|nr:hypothetical protein [Bacteroidales bacterium]
MKAILFWTVAVLITVGAAMYQRMTGPTYPDRVKVTIEGSEYELSLKRSQTNTHPCNIGIEIPDNITGKIFYRKFRTDDEWVSVPMNHDGSRLAGELPSQPAAGKLEYYIILTPPSGGEITIGKDEPVVIRFKGNVPAAVMIPHILIMFFAMLMSNLAGLTAAFGKSEQKKYGRWALWLLIA